MAWIPLTHGPNDCDCNENLIAAASLRDPNVPTQLRQAMQIVLLNYIISHMSGSDVFTLDELLSLGKCCCINNELDRDAVFTYLLLWLAQEISDAAPTTVEELTEQACRLNCGKADMGPILLKLWCLFLGEVEDCENRQIVL